MHRYKRFFGILALLFVLAGCRPTVDIHRPGDYDQMYSTYSSNFESFWQGMNMYYVYWSLEPQQYWDDVWDTYKPKFDALETRSSLPGADDAALRAEAHGYFTEFLAPLHDGHLTVLFNNGLTSISPNMNRVDARFASLTANNNPKRVFRSTWSGIPFTGDTDYINYKFWENTISGYMQNDVTKKSYYNIAQAADPDRDPTSIFLIATGHIACDGGFILYFYCSSFKIKVAASDRVAVNEIILQYLNDITNSNLKGIIIDLRGNLGGYANETDLLLDRLIHRPLLITYERYKNGLNRLDYKPWTPRYINPHPVPAERVQNDVSVVALVNDYSISCGEVAPMAIRAMPKGYIIGTQTFGAMGPRYGDVSPAVANGGSFENRSSVSLWYQVGQAGFQTKGADGASYEGSGLMPDEVVEFDWAEFYGDGAGSGRDRQLLAAIKYIDAAYTGP
jgi:hypothetical protein